MALHSAAKTYGVAETRQSQEHSFCCAAQRPVSAGHDGTQSRVVVAPLQTEIGHECTLKERCRKPTYFFELVRAIVELTQPVSEPSPFFGPVEAKDTGENIAAGAGAN